MRGRQDLANDGTLDNGPSGTLGNLRTKRFLIFSARSSARALIARFGVTHPSPRARTHATARAPAYPTIAFRELSNSPPLTRSCQEGSDAISLDSAFYAGPAIAFCDGSRIHGDADRGDLDCAEKNEMSSHLLYGALSSRCLKATRSECSDAILVLGLSLVVQAATQNPKARETDRQDTRDHNGGGRHAAGVQASLCVRARPGLIQILQTAPPARPCRGV